MILVLLALLLLVIQNAHADDLPNLEAIKQIESHGDSLAHNLHSGARGLYQITPIVLLECNKYARCSGAFVLAKFDSADLFDPVVNERIARWYLYTRIPGMLRAYGEPVTTRNILISYNAGIKYVVEHKSLPPETRAYLRKYQEITK